MPHQGKRLFPQPVKGADHIVACKVYSDKYRDVAVETIRDDYRKFAIEFSPTHFTGLQPDILVIGSYGTRIRSVLGDYNSRIVLSAFVAGLTTDECAKAFNRVTFERANYFEEFAWSSDTMLSRETALGQDGIKIADWFLDEVRKTPLLYSVNHPTPRVFARYAEQILDRFGIERRKSVPELLHNQLSTDVIWPVHEEIAAAHDIGYSTEPTFWKNGVSLTLEEFIWRSYLSYEELGRDFLREAMGDRAISF